MAKVFDKAAVDVLLVGDPLAHVILGLDTTVPVTLNAVIHYTRAASRDSQRALVGGYAVLELSGHYGPGDAECSTTVSEGRHVCGEDRLKA
jgi:hypothetical protein